MVANDQQDLVVRYFATEEDLPLRVQHAESSPQLLVWVAKDAYKSEFPGSYTLKSLPFILHKPGQPKKSQEVDRRQARESCVREAKAIRYACHQHVVKIAMAYFLEDDRASYFGIMMERADENLGSYLSSKMDDTKKGHVSGWFSCLANAVAHIHGLGIQHRDIKPANILLKNNSVLLADFGISKGGLGQTLSTTLKKDYRDHTRIYAAPEVAKGGERSRAADIFSLGAVFLEMLDALYDGNTRRHTLEIPVPISSSSTWTFASNLETVDKWIKALDEKAQKAKPNWHRELVSLCRNMLSEEREKRQSAKDVCKTLSKPTSGLCNCKQVSTSTDSQRLVVACRNKNGVADVKDLLSQNNTLRDTPGAIHQAAAHGFLDIVKVFFEYGVNVDLLDQNCQTALHCASKHGHRRTSIFLIERHAKVTLQDEDGQTPLHIASRGGHLTVVKKLLEADAHERQGLVHKLTTYKRMALHLAAMRGHKEVVESLLDKMNLQSISQKDRGSQTAFHLAADFGSEGVVASILEYATNAAQDPKPAEAAEAAKVAKAKAVKSAEAAKAKATKASEAAEAAKVEAIKTARAAEAARSALADLVGTVDNKGYTALHIAAKGRRTEASYSRVIRRLLEGGVDPGVRSKAGKTAKRYAEQEKHDERASLFP